jgi:transketolase
MRAEFGEEIKQLVTKDEKIVFLTGDLGFMALEGIREAMGQRFVNAGVSEQNMITMAAAMASEGLTPICYSIAPFTVFRPAEQIRLDVCLHNQNVKIVGNGGGYGYGIMGSTHHAIEDIGVLSCFQHMVCYIPFCNEDVAEVVKAMMKRKGPAYLRLGKGPKPEKITLPKYQPIRRVVAGEKATIISIGPVALNAIAAAEELGTKINKPADIFVVSEIPVLKLTAELIASLKKTKKLLIIEEHVSRGGLAENISLLLMKAGIVSKTIHLCANGYENGRYGSQNYHFEQSELDVTSITKKLEELINE